MLAIALLLSFIAGSSAFASIGNRMIKSKLGAIEGQGGIPTAIRALDGEIRVPGEHPKYYILENDNGSKATVRTFGGNLFTWTPAGGEEVMGKRDDAKDITQDSGPYAGGAPHCFPQFGPGELMQHGFARGMMFVPEERAKKVSFDRMIFKLQPTEETLNVWNHNFEYRFDVTLRENSLEWDVCIINLDSAPFDCTLGLHNYYDVSSLGNVVVSGPFSGAATVDKESGATGTASSDDITINSPTDMLYKGVTGPITITDKGKGTRLTLESKGYTDTVIWSPYGNNAMGYDKFICVEPVCSDPVSIPPGKYKETKFYHKVTYEKL